MRTLARLAPLLLIGCNYDNPLFKLDPSGGPGGGGSESSSSTGATTGPEPTTGDPIPDTTGGSSTEPVDPVTATITGTDSSTTVMATTDDTTGQPDLCQFAGEFPIDPQIYVSIDPPMPMKNCMQPIYLLKGALSMKGGTLSVQQIGNCQAPLDGPTFYFGQNYPADDRTLNCVEIQAHLIGPMADCRIGALSLRNLDNGKQVYLGVFDQHTPPNFPLKPALINHEPCDCDQSPCCAPVDPGQYDLGLFGTTIPPGESVMMQEMGHTGWFHNFHSHVTPECKQDPAAAYQVAWLAEVL